MLPSVGRVRPGVPRKSPKSATELVIGQVPVLPLPWSRSSSVVWLNLPGLTTGEVGTSCKLDTRSLPMVAVHPEGSVPSSAGLGREGSTASNIVCRLCGWWIGGDVLQLQFGDKALRF